MNANLKIDNMTPFGTFTFSFGKSTKVLKNTTRIHIGECVIIHLPVSIDEKEMKVIHKVMKSAHTDILEHNGNYYTTTSNGLCLVKHPLLGNLGE